MIRVSFFVFCAVGVCQLGLAQGILGHADDRALDCLVDYASGRDDMPDEYAAVVRMEHLQLTFDGGVSKADRIYIYVDSRKSNQRYVGQSIFSEQSDGRTTPRFWNQLLVSGLHRSMRSGSAIPPFDSFVTEDRKTDPKESKTILLLPEFDPYFFPIARPADCALRRVSRRFGETVLEQYELLEAKSKEQGLIVSTWRNNKKLTKIEFDPRQGGRPVKIVRLGVEKVAGDSESRPIEGIHVMRWKKAKFGPQKTIWLPAFFRRLDIDENNGGGEEELECHFQWLDTSKESALPKTNERDWREPVRKRLDEDWTLAYQDWLRNREKQGNGK